MKTLLITLVCISLLCAAGFAFSQKAETVWEYKFSDTCSEKKANEYGAQGWELTSVDSAGSYPVKMSTCIFKRQKH